MKRTAFTLVEVLVVTGIIGLLSSTTMTNLAIARMRSRDTKRISDIHQIQNALALEYDTKGSYPSSFVLGNKPYPYAIPGTDCGSEDRPADCSSASTVPVNGHWIYNGAGRNLGRVMPQDPIPPSRNVDEYPYGGYYYYAWDDYPGYGPDSQFYLLMYTLEGTPGGKDAEAIAASGYWVNNSSNTDHIPFHFTYGLWYDNDYLYSVGKTGE